MSNRFIVAVYYHSKGDQAVYITESKHGRLSGVSDMDNATSYSTEGDALNRAHRYARQIVDDGDGENATLKVLAIVTLAETTDSIVSV